MSFPFNQFIKQAREDNKSQEFIEATVFYAQKLDNLGFPVIFSIEHLAMLMGVQSDFLRHLIGERKKYKYQDEPYKSFRYNYFKLKKRNGGYREIMSPSKDLKFIQKWILINILEKHHLTDSCTGFRKGISIKDNAKPHENSEVVLKVDLLRFFDTITEKRVFTAFADIGYRKNLAVSLAKITTAQHKKQYWKSMPRAELKVIGYEAENAPSVLPQGAPTSPALANILANTMDYRFEKLSEKLGFKYSRYADDLTFSIRGDQRLPSLRIIKQIIEEEKFVVNEKKIQYLRRGSKQYVTGLTTTNGINVSKKYRKKIGSHIYYCRQFGVKDHLKRIAGKDQNPQGVLPFHDWLYGHICFISSVNRHAGDKLLEGFSKIDWFI
ncbi:reverse transcriptase family protein [Zunongwangia sp. F363]|uniref:RNA-directed DNA polymerase n=1 Tax=Autumnicola tepida TaxID=3075595 RepID=A0ABU3C914_9FLAO|nr:reverse transcriptase family protein [Zunongwangia sp. F363]MDT0642833.1 reverse transcriptase family protein [Zunongwangia sp. F363]